MFKYTRSPNFLGEVMIYLSFAVCVGITEVYLAFILYWVVFFGAFILRKEISNSKKKEWLSYKQHSWVFLPKIIPSSSFWSGFLYFLWLSLICWIYINY